MATTEPKKTAATLATEQAGRTEAALERLTASLDAAQEAAKALRTDVGRGTRDMARNVEKMLAATRKDAGRLAKAVRADLADLQKAMISPPARKPGGKPTRAPRSGTATRGGTPRRRGSSSKQATQTPEKPASTQRPPRES
jgi:hypothetical protein